MTEQFNDPDIPRKRSGRADASTFGRADGSAFGRAASASHEPPAHEPPAHELPAYVPPSTQPQFGPSAHEFAAWLAHQPDVTAALFEDTMNTFESVLVVMRDEGLRPDVPQHMEKIIQLMFTDDAEGGSDPDLFDEVMAAVDIYLHFRMENSRDPEDWEDVHEVLEDAIEARDGADLDGPLNELLREEDPVPDDVKLRAYAALPILRAVPELLTWIGKGSPVTATGALRRADIEFAAGLLGIRAHGTNEPWSPRSASDPGAPIAARSMSDVPLLEAWWESLQTAHVIERDRSRMRPGPAAGSTSAALTLDAAEEVIAYFLANAVSGSGWMAPVAADVAVETIATLFSAVAPERVAPGLDPDEPPTIRDELIERLAESRIRDLASMGLLAATADGGWSVPDELRHVVARATMLAATLVMAGGELDDED